MAMLNTLQVEVDHAHQSQEGMALLQTKDLLLKAQQAESVGPA